MPSAGMDSSQWSLTSLDAEVTVSATRADRAGLGDRSGILATPFNQSLEWTLQRFRQRFGNTWVTGRVALFSDSLKFHPRGHDDRSHSSTPLMVRLVEISSVEVESHLLTRMVRVGIASGQQLTFRCKSPYEFAENLRMAAGAVRASAA